MSLLSTLLRAGSELHTALEKRPSIAPGGTDSRARGKRELPAQPGADRFTPSESKEDDSTRKVSKLAIADYKKSVGQDLAFISRNTAAQTCRVQRASGNGDSHQK